MIQAMPPLSGHERALLANEAAQERIRQGLGPPPPTPKFPPAVRVEFDTERSQDGILSCHACGATRLRIVRRFHDEDGQVGQLILCDGCGRPFGLVICAEEDEHGQPFVTVAVRVVGSGTGPETWKPQP